MHLCFFTASEFYSFVVVVVVWYRTRRNGGPFFFWLFFFIFGAIVRSKLPFLRRPWTRLEMEDALTFGLLYLFFVCTEFLPSFFFQRSWPHPLLLFFLLLSLFIRSAFYRVVPLDVPLCYLWFVGYLVFFHINLFLVFLIHLTCFYRVFFRINLARLFNGTASASTW